MCLPLRLEEWLSTAYIWPTLLDSESLMANSTNTLFCFSVVSEEFSKKCKNLQQVSINVGNSTHFYLKIYVSLPSLVSSNSMYTSWYHYLDLPLPLICFLDGSCSALGEKKTQHSLVLCFSEDWGFWTPLSCFVLFCFVLFVLPLFVLL